MADDTRPPTASPTIRSSPHFDMAALQRGVGIRFKGREREDVEEYCASEGWIRVQAGKAVDRHGMPVTVKLNGEVETWWRDQRRDGRRIEASNSPPGRPQNKFNPFRCIALARHR